VGAKDLENSTQIPTADSYRTDDRNLADGRTKRRTGKAIRRFVQADDVSAARWAKQRHCSWVLTAGTTKVPPNYCFVSDSTAAIKRPVWQRKTHLLRA
jgi:hypothetical protein